MTAADAPFPLEPLGLGESLDAGFRLWRGHFSAFFLLSLFAVLPSALISGWYQANNVLAVTPSGELLVEDTGAFFRGSLGYSLLGLVIMAVMWAALVHYGVNAYVGRTMAIGDAVTGGLSRIVPFAGLALMYWLIVVLGTIAFVIPGIYLGVRFILAFPAFFAEGSSPTGAFSRGGAMAQGRWWRIFGLLVSAWFINLILVGVIGALVGGFLPELTNDNISSFFYTAAVVDGALGALFLPVLPAMMIVAYFDGRVRKEGFDIEFMTQQLDDEPRGPEADETGGGLIR